MRTLSAKTKKIIAYLQANPDAKVAVVAKKFKTAPTYIYKLRDRANSAATKGKGVGRLNGVPLEQLVQSARKAGARVEVAVTPDMVNHPPHYTVGGIETIGYMEAKSTHEEFIGHLRLTALKYLSRANHKGDTVKDLKKAQWYLNKLVSTLESK